MLNSSRKYIKIHKTTYKWGYMNKSFCVKSLKDSVQMISVSKVQKILYSGFLCQSLKDSVHRKHDYLFAAARRRTTLPGAGAGAGATGAGGGRSSSSASASASASTSASTSSVSTTSLPNP